MFAVALFDRRDRKLYLTRDRFGENLYTMVFPQKVFLFTSDLSALNKHPCFEKKISPQALKLFLNYSYVPAPYCIYENFFKVQPGEIVKS